MKIIEDNKELIKKMFFSMLVIVVLMKIKLFIVTNFITLVDAPVMNNWAEPNLFNGFVILPFLETIVFQTIPYFIYFKSGGGKVFYFISMVFSSIMFAICHTSTIQSIYFNLLQLVFTFSIGCILFYLYSTFHKENRYPTIYVFIIHSCVNILMSI